VHSRRQSCYSSIVSLHSVRYSHSYKREYFIKEHGNGCDCRRNKASFTEYVHISTIPVFSSSVCCFDNLKKKEFYSNFIKQYNFEQITEPLRSRDSSVDKAKGRTAGVRFPARTKIFSLLNRVQSGTGALSNRYRG
jgi:hypothetical protein